MLPKMHIKLALIIFVYTFSIVISVTCATFNFDNFERKKNALTKVLKYTLQRPSQMNLDTTIGITFAEANIKAALQHKNVKFLDKDQKKILIDVLKLSENTRQKIHASANLPTEAAKEFSLKVNRPEIWIRPIIWKKLNLEKKPNNSTVENSGNSMFAGHPQEHESDFCLLNLIDNCQFVNKCQDMIISNENTTTGYSLTHKLLMMQMIVACETSIKRFHSYLSHKFCSLILQDLRNLEAIGFSFASKDLALEQVFLCGMEGYLDFLGDHYVQLVLDWQHPSGCYTKMRYNEDLLWRHVRSRRAANFTDFGCLNHATGLGIAVLALLIRKDIEMITEFYSKA